MKAFLELHTVLGNTSRPIFVSVDHIVAVTQRIGNVGCLVDTSNVTQYEVSESYGEIRDMIRTLAGLA